MADGQAPETVTTKVDHGYTDMKPGTSGLRKKTRVFMQDDNLYLKVFVQAMFTALTDLGDSLGLEDQVLVVSGDGRYFSTEAISIIASIAHANGVKKLWVGANGLMSTPCVSHIIRERNGGVANGGIILTASHNPGGIDEDFGVKYNDANGGPASSVITDAIFQATLAEGGIELKESTWGEGNTIDLTTPGEYLGGFVEVFDAVSEYVAAMEPIFDLDAIAAFLQRPDFTMIYDAMNGVAGPFAEAVFRGRLGAGEDSVILRRCDPLPDFGGHHPDPNLVYCRDLAVDFGVVPRSDDDPAPMDPPPQFGAAADGDADRNMIVGAGRFVTPSDSVAIIAHYAKDAIPFFKDGLKAVARSMPTSRALDYVATALDVPLFEVPTGWKYFGNLMNSGPSGGTDYNPLICGEESFGTGSNHVREKDGLWAVLCWLAILAHRNPDPAAPLVTVDTIVTEFWAQYGRSYYCRYDYENVETEAAMAVIARLNEFIDADAMPVLGGRQVVLCDNFEYTDPVDALVTANQGIRFGFEDGSRFVVRLSGTGVVGKTIRLYLEQYVGPDGDVMLETADALAPLIAIAMDASQIPELTGRDGPTVIT